MSKSQQVPREDGVIGDSAGVTVIPGESAKLTLLAAIVERHGIEHCDQLHQEDRPDEPFIRVYPPGKKARDIEPGR